MIEQLSLEIEQLAYLLKALFSLHSTIILPLRAE
jgi:hypothetical protein